MLTTTQLAALAADILADPTLSQIDHTSNAGYIQLAAAYNLAASPTFFGYRTAIPTQELFNGITWANMTPLDAVPTDTALNVAIWQARSLACQGKQFNVQTMLMGQSFIDASHTSVRAGLQDALSNVPSGANGTTVSAGWVTVRDTILARASTRAEKLFATTTAQQDGSTAAKAATFTFQGTIQPIDISAVFS